MKLVFIFYIIVMTLGTTAQADSSSEKKLPLCLNSPNCVSSQADPADTQHYIAPFKIRGSQDKAWAALKKALNDRSRTVITHETEDSLHAEATSLMLHFVDDINVIVDADAGLIHIRSASRIGHNDFGVNRKRVEALRLQLQKAHLIE